MKKQMESTQVNKIDPIRKKFFDPIETAEKYSGALFIVVAVLSFLALYFDETSSKKLNSAIQWLFLVSVVVLFFLDVSIRLFLSPRAQDARSKDFLSKVYGTPLAQDLTTGYYNNSQTTPAKKIAAQTFENSLFSKEIAWAMFKITAPVAGIYLLIWFAALANHDVSISVVAACAQVIFGEQILSRCIRLLWIARRFENTYSELHRLFLSGASNAAFSAMALESYTKYEATKALGGITLSSKIFDKLNPRLSTQWDETCRSLSI